MSQDRVSGSVPSESAALLRFGPFELELATHQLRRRGALLRLQQQPAKVLALLASRQGELVTREEIQRRVWGEGTFVNFDQGLNFCIKEVRAALGDQADTPRFVETLPRRGYRFIAPVEALPARPAELPPDPEARRAGPSPEPARRRARWASVLAALLAAGLLAAALGWRARTRPADSPPASPGRIMLAVLPFENLSADPGQDYLSEGLTEELIAQLGRAQPDRLGVIARTSAMRYKAGGKGLEDIGRELGVGYVVEGSVRRGGDRVRITVNLVVVSDRTQIWAEAYDRKLDDLLTLQREVAEAVARRIEITLSPVDAQRLARAEARDPAAYELFLRGRYFWNKRDEAGLRRSIEYFRKAIERQPGYALAYVGLADAFIVLGDHGYLPPKEAYPAARAAADRALELDASLAEAQVSRAMIRAAFEWDWRASVEGFRHALALNPNYATGHHWYAHCLRALGRVDEALLETRRALELDPLSLIINNNVATALFYAGRYEEALVQYRRTLELDPDWGPAHWSLGRTELRMGRHAAAIASLEAGARIGGNQSEYVATLAYGYAEVGRPAAAGEMLARLLERRRQRYVSSYDLAIASAAAGDREAAFRFLEAAFEEKQSGLRLLKVDERLASLRADPRHADLLARLGLAE